MATAPQAAMEMPQQGANPFADPNTMAVYDQLRQTTSSKQFGDEMLAGASQIDPQAVAEFTQELQGLDMPPEVLDALNDVVDEILASPERYSELRAKYMDQGLPEEILPEQFDPRFFAALNMAIDQMIAAPSGVQAFAQGGIAELKPIAKAIASYGRNGDTMLAHITPAEARMLRRRGGSGTINPDTGLPEFFIKTFFKFVGKQLKTVGKAVKKFASSTVGRIITTVALGFFLGPAAAGLLGVSSAVGVAAVSGFIGSAGATLLGGGNIGQALKAGAIGGLTAGAGAGLTGGSFASGSASTAGMTAGEAVSSQFNKFTNFLTPSAAAPTPINTSLDATGAAPVPDPLGDFIQQNDAARTAANTPIGIKSVAGPLPSTDPLGDFIQQNDAARTAANTPARLPVGQTTASAQPGAYKPTTIGESFTKMGEGLGMGEGEASFKTFKEGAGELFSPTGPSTEQINARATELVVKSPKLPFDTAVKQATSELAPGMLRTYGPAAVAGLGTLAAFGGFDSKPAQGGDASRSLMKPVTQRIAEAGTQRQMYMQGLPGVVYDQYGAPVYGQSTRLPTYDVPDYNSGGYRMSQGPAPISMPSTYIPQPGSIGASSVAQPYNTADMYSNLVPRQYAEGGHAVRGYAKGGPITELYRSVLNREPNEADIKAWTDAFGTEVDELELARFRREAAPEIAAIQAANVVKTAEQKAARDAVAQQKAIRRSQGSGQMYNNINAGLAALAPESFPGTLPALSPDRLKAIQEAYAGIAARPADQVSDAERYQVARQNKFSPAEIAAAYPGIGFGEVNRIMGRGAIQQNYAPMLQGQRDAMAKQKTILDNTGIGTGTGYREGDLRMYDQPFPMPRFTNAGKQPSGKEILPPDFPGFDDQTRFGMPGGPPPYSMGEGGRGLPPGMGGGMGDQPMDMVYRGGMPEISAQQRRQREMEMGRIERGMGDRSNIAVDRYIDPRKFNVNKPLPDQPLFAMGDPNSPGYQSTLPPPMPTPDYPGGQFGHFGIDEYGRGAFNGFGDPPPVGGVKMRDGPGYQDPNKSGIAALAQGGYPRRTGQISGPGTEKSDSIPAMLSDGEFVMTAKAVRGAGKGSRRAGAKKMYALMHQLEKNSERG